MKYLEFNKFTKSVALTALGAYGAAMGSVISEFEYGLRGAPVTVKEVLPYAAVGAVTGVAAALKVLRRH